MYGFKALEKHQAKIVDAWVQLLLNDQSSLYSRESQEDLRPLVNQGTHLLRQVLDGGPWDDLNAFLTVIAHKRLSQGFRLSEVQKSFIVYQQVVTPILIREASEEDVDEAMFLLSNCLSQTLGTFSDFFQELHEECMRKHTIELESEVRKRTHELLESKSKYKALVEDIRDGYYVTHEGTIIYANNAFCSMHGRSMADIVGVPFVELVAQESRGEVRRSHDPNRAHHASSLLEYLRLHQDGRKLPTETLVRFSFYQGQAVNLGICRDISERRTLEQKTREAETLNALAQQAAALAHDIRNPLTAIKMNVQMLAEELKDNPTHHRLIEISQKQVERIELSLMEMMDLARPFRLNKEIVFLRPFIQGCIEALRSRMVYKELSISVRLNANLDQLRMDPLRIEQTLVNLLFNAIEAVSTGGRIYVSSGIVQFQGRHWGRICVADNGPGVPKELLPFFFDENCNRRIGLGLDNVRKIIKAHGGVVEIRNRRPRGIRVCLLLPLEQ